MSESRYIIQGGQPGRSRLSIIARALEPTTRQLLEKAGIAPGMRCLDVGCGGGDVTLEMAQIVGQAGRVVGVDFDADILRLAREEAELGSLYNVDFQCADALTYRTEAEFDIVYSRFLLTHLNDPARCLNHMIQAAKPAGMVVVEDIDFSARFCYPPNASFQRYLDLYSQVARHRGGDPHIGFKLPEMFMRAGMKNVQVHVIQPVHLEGEAKQIAQVTMQRISAAVVQGGFATQEEVDEIVSDIADFTVRPDTLMSFPRIFQVWGVRDQ